MKSGPSKAELKMYWENSRQYFDELAAHYREHDPEYYDEFIAPFYNNPLYSVGTPRPQGSSSRPAALVFLATAILIAGGVAAFVLFLSTQEGDEKIKEPVKKVESNKDTTYKQFITDYDRAMGYYDDGDWENAEKYFRRVKRSDKNYPDAQEKLREIADKKQPGKEKDRTRPRPIERTR